MIRHLKQPRMHAARRGGARLGFTLTELLVVVGIMVLMITLAVPAFRVITGGRSIDAAQNQVAALLARARTDAVALQEERGLLFYLDPATGQVAAVLVRSRTDVASSPEPVTLDLLPDRDGLVLPTGISLQTIINGAVTPGTPPTRTSDGFLGYNRVPGPAVAGRELAVAYGGVILFDGQGRLESKSYQFAATEMTGPLTSRTKKWTQLGRLLYDVPSGGGDPPGSQADFVTFVPAANAPQSQVGLVLFESDGFTGQNFTPGDPRVDSGVGSYSSGEQAEEDWISANSIPFLVNRYNGTLIRAGE